MSSPAEPEAVDPPVLRRRRRWPWVAVALALPLTLLLGPWLLLSAVSEGERYDVDAVPPRPVAIVFGAGLQPDGTPGTFLVQRLEAAVRLWQLGKVQHVLVTGDNSTPYHDEVSAMQLYLVRRGVPEGVITRDFAGFDTYDSCYRAKAVFGVRRAVVVTQDYHLARALWTCSRAGIDVVGVGPSRWRTDRGRMVRYQARELLSDGKALWQTVVTRPEPHFLGPSEPLR